MSSRPEHTPLVFARDDYGIWSWCLYDGEVPAAMCSGFESRQDAVRGFRKLTSIPVETLLTEAAVQNTRGDAIEWSGEDAGPVKALDGMEQDRGSVR